MEWVATMSHELDSQDLAAGGLGRANMQGSDTSPTAARQRIALLPSGPSLARDLETEFTQHEFEAYFERWRPIFAGAGFHARVNFRVARSYVAKSFTALATTNAPVMVASNCEASSDERPSSTSLS